MLGAVARSITTVIMRSARAAACDALYRARVALAGSGRRRISNPREMFGGNSDRYW